MKFHIDVYIYFNDNLENSVLSKHHPLVDDLIFFFRGGVNFNAYQVTSDTQEMTPKNNFSAVD